VSISIRLRLTVWFSAAVAVLLAVVSAGLLLAQTRTSVARLDAEMQRVAATVAAVLQNELSEGLMPPLAAAEALAEVNILERHIAILNTAGELLAAEWTLPSPPVAVGDGGRMRWTVDRPTRARLHAYTEPPVPPGAVVVMAAEWDEIEDEREDLIRGLATVIPLALALVASGSWWIAGRALRPARRMADEARQITEQSSGSRLTIDRQDELGVLATAFNELLQRLHDAIKERRRFLAEASHELRTPVSVARTAADVALSRSERPEVEYREALAIVSRQMRQQGRLVADMLALARTDISEWPLTPHEFYFDELVTEVERAMRLAAIARGVTVVTRCPVDLQIHGDEGLLTQMLTNLIENAIRHTPAGREVGVNVTADTRGIRVAVRDTGPGIDLADRERIFEPFVRIDPVDNTGSGLGLVIARRIARVHGGDVTLEATSSGTTFVITLPRLC